MSTHRTCPCGKKKSPGARTCSRCFHDSQRLPLRYPYAPLAALLGGSHRYQATRLGLERSTVERLCYRGLSPWQADRYAVAAGVHPSALWPSWFTDALTEENAA